MRWIILLLSVLTFLAAAKTHGRQVRLERELAGHMEVHFGGVNDPFVEALWRRDRSVYWFVAGLSALIALAVRLTDPAVRIFRGSRGVLGSWQGVVLFNVVLPFILAFTAAGIVSLAHFLIASGETQFVSKREWIGDVLKGSAGWWTLTVGLEASLGLLTFHKSH